jgi:hypothetical protein
MIVYSQYEPLIERGATPYHEGSSWLWFDDGPSGDGDYDYSQVHIPSMDYGLDVLVDRGWWTKDNPLMIDIENFKMDAFGIQQLQVAAMRAKSFRPDFPIGFYRLVPERNYWGPVGGNYFEIRDWERRNTANASVLVPFVDMLFPSIYAHYPGKVDKWKLYAKANMEEAFRVCQGKPVVPVLMPSYAGKKGIEPDKWQAMVDFCVAYPGVTAIAVHMSPSYVVSDAWIDTVTAELKDLQSLGSKEEYTQ